MNYWTLEDNTLTKYEVESGPGYTKIIKDYENNEFKTVMCIFPDEPKITVTDYKGRQVLGQEIITNETVIWSLASFMKIADDLGLLTAELYKGTRI